MKHTLRKNENEKHIVYALMLNKKPIYVGCCMNLKNREYAHRQSKIFDYAIVIKTYENKNDALMCENAIIRFMSLFDKCFVNGLFQKIVLQKEFEESWLDTKKESEVKNG